MDAVKNHDFLVDLAKSPRWPDDMVIALIGDGALRAHLEARVVAEGLGSRVRFLGVRADVPAIIKGLDLLLLPSHHEGLPMVLVEAQAAGTPCLVSTGVPVEADLGLGLVDRVELDPQAWMAALREERPTRPDVDTIRRQLVDRGYDSAAVARCLTEIYVSNGLG